MGCSSKYVNWLNLLLYNQREGLIQKGEEARSLWISWLFMQELHSCKCMGTQSLHRHLAQLNRCVGAGEWPQMNTICAWHGHKHMVHSQIMALSAYVNEWGQQFELVLIYQKSKSMLTLQSDFPLSLVRLSEN